MKEAATRSALGRFSAVSPGGKMRAASHSLKWCCTPKRRPEVRQVVNSAGDTPLHVCESAELMALLLKKPRGLGSVRLVDASFIWTEPHSRRIKIKACVQKEVVSG